MRIFVWLGALLNLVAFVLVTLVGLTSVTVSGFLAFQVKEFESFVLFTSFFLIGVNFLVTGVYSLINRQKRFSVYWKTIWPANFLLLAGLMVFFATNEESRNIWLFVFLVSEAIMIWISANYLYED